MGRHINVRKSGKPDLRCFETRTSCALSMRPIEIATAAYFFRCFFRKSVKRGQAAFADASWKLPRSSQWKPCGASG